MNSFKESFHLVKENIEDITEDGLGAVISRQLFRY